MNACTHACAHALTHECMHVCMHVGTFVDVDGVDAYVCVCDD